MLHASRARRAALGNAVVRACAAVWDRVRRARRSAADFPATGRGQSVVGVAEYLAECLEPRRLLSAASPVSSKALVSTATGVTTQDLQPATTPADIPSYSPGDPITAQAGSSFVVEATVANSNLTNPVILPPLYYPPLSGSVIADMHLSPDGTPYNGYPGIGQATQNVYLTLGSSTKWTVVCTMPKSVAPGKYSLVELIDLSGTNANTNQYWQVTNIVTITSGPLISGLPQRVVATGQLTPSVPITNDTDQPFAGQETVTYSLQNSADPTSPISLG